MENPNDEGLTSHRLYDQGLRGPMFAGEVVSSRWLADALRLAFRRLATTTSFVSKSVSGDLEGVDVSPASRRTHASGGGHSAGIARNAFVSPKLSPARGIGDQPFLMVAAERGTRVHPLAIGADTGPPQAIGEPANTLNH